MAIQKKLLQYGGGALFGGLLQSFGGTTKDKPKLTDSTYKKEQSSNTAYPSTNQFMGLPLWMIGGLLSHVLPTEVLKMGVNHLSKPSNPQTDTNRQLLPMIVSGLMSLPIVPPFIGMLGRVGGGLVHGSEIVAQKQGKQTKRKSPTTNLRTDLDNAYQKAGDDYYENGHRAQGNVMKVMTNTNGTDGNVSHEIYKNLNNTKTSPFEKD